ncbi:MAG: DUF1223 domain-containing protein [Fibrobacteria bacterium]
MVELFTSEGCSSCPPADALLAGFADDAERTGHRIFALSFHVDYWNYLGWKDPFSRPEFSERQQRYARALDGQVYTPQMIVNGAVGFIGSQSAQAHAALASALAQPATAAIAVTSVTRAPVSAASARASWRVGYKVTGHRGGDILNLALVERGLSVPVRRGENGGRTLRHENVVRAFRNVRLDAAGSGSLELEMPEGVAADRAFLIAYAQGGESLAVLGAARAGLRDSPPSPPSSPSVP